MKSRTHCFVVLVYEPKLREVEDVLRAIGEYDVYLIDNTEKPERKLSTLLLDKQADLPDTVYLTASRENLGYAGGVNIGLGQAFHHGHAWATVMNVDVTVGRETVQSYLYILKDTSPGIAGVYPGYLDPWRWSSILEKDYHVRAQPQYVSGSFWSIHRNVPERIGYLYERYFLYYEETEYCVRAKAAGFPITHIPMKAVIHSDVSGLGRGSQLHRYYLARNHLLFAMRNAPWYVKLHELARIPRTIWQHFTRGEYGAVKGDIDYFLGRRGRFRGKL